MEAYGEKAGGGVTWLIVSWEKEEQVRQEERGETSRKVEASMKERPLF